jgi:hypothetical protein
MFFINTLHGVFDYIFQYFNNKKKMKEFEQKAQHCHVFYNDYDILIFAVHLIPPGFDIYDIPANVVLRDISPESLGSLVNDALNESRIVYDENCIDTADSILYEYTNVNDWETLVKKWKLIIIEKMLCTTKVIINVPNAVDGAYLGTSDDPVYYASSLNPVEIGSILRHIINGDQSDTFEKS